MNLKVFFSIISQLNDLSLMWKMVIRKLNWEFINNRSTKRSNNSYHKCPVHRLLIINLYFSKECVPKTYFHHGKNLNLSINWKVFDNLNARNSIFLEQGFKKRKIGKVLSLENLTTFKIIVKEEAKSATIDNTNIPTPHFPIKGEIENATSNRKRVSRFVLSLSLSLSHRYNTTIHHCKLRTRFTVKRRSIEHLSRATE